MPIRRFDLADRDAVVALWRRCGLVQPEADPHGDIDRKLAAQPDLFFVEIIDHTLVGTVMAGYEGHRGWINYLAVEPKARRQGIGSRLMRHAEDELAKLGCPKVNLQVRGSNATVASFYESIGYQLEDRLSFGRRL